MRLQRAWSVVLVAATLSFATTALQPPPAGAVTVVPTQWVAKVITEGLGRAPSGPEWNFWMAYYTPNGCTKDTLAGLGRALYKNQQFTDLYPESTSRAARVLALVRGVYSHEPNTADWNAYYVPYANGSKTWAQVVDSIFDNGVFAALVVPSICSATDPNYGFPSTAAFDVNPNSGGAASRTQKQLQQALDNAAPSCGTVALQPREVVRIGGAQPAGDPQNNPLRVPACVTLTTAGSPDARHYANMGRLVSNGLVCAAPWLTCDHIEMVRLGDGAALRNVWIDGKGLGTNARLGLVGVASGQAPTQVVDDRLSDAPEGGTALRVVGYGVSGVACSGRDISRNLVTGYTTKHAHTRLGRAQWADGLSIFCEGATVQGNDLVDVSGDGIVVAGAWNTEHHDQRPQHSTVSGNHVVSAGISGTVAYAAEPAGECNAEPAGLPAGCIQSDARPGSPDQRDFTGTSFANNRFWTGARTAFDIGLMIGSKPVWGDNGPYAAGASFTGNTTDGVSGTRVNTGIAVSGMFNTTLTGNTDTYSVVDTQPTVDNAGKCAQGNVLLGAYIATLTAGSQPATGSAGLYQCLAPPPPVGGLERITVSGTTFVGASSGERFVPWGNNLVADTVSLADMREMKEMGTNVIRPHLEFNEFMVDCTTPNTAMLDQLAEMLHVAEQNAMYLDLTGLASYDGDAADPDCYGDATTDEQRWSAQEVFWGAIAQVTAGSPAVLDLDLVNEPTIPSSSLAPGCWADCLTPNADPGTFFTQVLSRNANNRPTSEIATAWLTRMTNAIRQYDPNHLITIGCLPFTNCGGLGLDVTPNFLGYQSVHIYPIDCTGPRPPDVPEDQDPCGAGFFNQRPSENASGDPLTYEFRILDAYTATQQPVLVEETGVVTEVPVQRDFLLRTRGIAAGWMGHARSLTLAQLLVSSNVDDRTKWAPWEMLFQDLTHIMSPCGTCPP